MDRMTAVAMLLIVVALVGVVYYVGTLTQQAPTGPGSITVTPAKVDVDHWKVRVYLKEGVGPNSGSRIDGNITAYLTEIGDVYDIPSDAVVADQQSTTNGEALFDIAVDPDYMTDNGMPVYFVAEADGHYKNMATVTVPKQAIADEIDREHAVTIKLDKVATMGWSADDAYRGTDSPVLRYKSTDELYKSIFEIKPQIDFETDKASGVFVVKKVYLEADINADMANVDRIDAKIGDVEFTDLTASDLPKTQKLDSSVTVDVDNPMNVEITVYTVDGSNSLASGTALLHVKLEDVLGNVFDVPVKVA